MNSIRFLMSLLVVVVVALTIVNPREVFAINILVEKSYLGVTTCTSNGATLVSTFFNEINKCENFDDFSMKYTCTSTLQYDQLNCQGKVVTSTIPKGCEAGVNFAKERFCVDANWHRVLLGNSSATCNSTTNTIVVDDPDNIFPEYLVPGGDCGELPNGDSVKLTNLSPDGTTVTLTNYGFSNGCTGTPVSKTVSIGVCFNNFGTNQKQVMLQKVVASGANISKGFSLVSIAILVGMVTML